MASRAIAPPGERFPRAVQEAVDVFLEHSLDLALEIGAISQQFGFEPAVEILVQANGEPLSLPVCTIGYPAIRRTTPSPLPYSYVIVP